MRWFSILSLVLTVIDILLHFFGGNHEKASPLGA